MLVRVLRVTPISTAGFKDCTVQRPGGPCGTGIQTSDIDSGGAMLSPPGLLRLQQQRKRAPSRSTDSRNDRRMNWAQSLTLRATVFSFLFRACAVDCGHVELKAFENKQARRGARSRLTPSQHGAHWCINLNLSKSSWWLLHCAVHDQCNLITDCLALGLFSFSLICNALQKTHHSVAWWRGPRHPVAAHRPAAQP